MATSSKKEKTIEDIMKEIEELKEKIDRYEIIIVGLFLILFIFLINFL